MLRGMAGRPYSRKDRSPPASGGPIEPGPEWARIVVLEGRLRYRILEPESEEIELSPGRPGIVEPEVLHEVEAPGPVRFHVDFCR